MYKTGENFAWEPNVAAAFRTFCAEYYLQCYDWLKLVEKIGSPDPRVHFSLREREGEERERETEKERQRDVKEERSKDSLK